mmetsp:Transcript_7784/g.29233  ORF Transcript_7784/g.29233 Transcript_7784/m.29233 type:complete len:93 (-) Transcript_7784:88-366(-)
MIACPVRTIIADPALGQGWPKEPEFIERRAGAVPQHDLVLLPGGHHLHLDSDTAPAVVESALEHFLQLDVPDWTRERLAEEVEVGTGVRDQL